MIIAALTRFQRINQDSTATTTNYHHSMSGRYSLEIRSLFELVSGRGCWLSLLAGWSNLVQLHEFGEIELWLLEDLDLSDHAVILEWEDFGGVFLNLLSDFLFN